MAGDGVRGAGCNCGRVRLELRGEPVRIGLCHCGTCRKETGGPFMAFAVWPEDRATVTGGTGSWRATTDTRHFCPACGSSLFSREGGEAEIEVRLGILDAMPSGFSPTYELWIPRREPWLRPVEGALQHGGNRPQGSPGCRETAAG